MGAVLWEVERQRAVSGADYGLTPSESEAETLYLAELKRGAAEDTTLVHPSMLASSSAPGTPADVKPSV